MLQFIRGEGRGGINHCVVTSLSALTFQNNPSHSSLPSAVSLLVTVSTRQVPGELRVGSHAGLDGESEVTSSVISVKL